MDGDDISNDGCHSLMDSRHDANHFFDFNDLNMMPSLSQQITSLECDHVTLSLSHPITLLVFH